MKKYDQSVIGQEARLTLVQDDEKTPLDEKAFDWVFNTQCDLVTDCEFSIEQINLINKACEAAYKAGFKACEGV